MAYLVVEPRGAWEDDTELVCVMHRPFHHPLLSLELLEQYPAGTHLVVPLGAPMKLFSTGREFWVIDELDILNDLDEL